MKQWFDKVSIAAYLRCQKGQGLVEYALIIALVAIVLAASLTGLKDDIAAVFTNIGETINKTTPPSPAS